MIGLEKLQEEDLFLKDGGLLGAQWVSMPKEATCHFKLSCPFLLGGATESGWGEGCRFSFRITKACPHSNMGI